MRVLQTFCHAQDWLSLISAALQPQIAPKMPPVPSVSEVAPVALPFHICLASAIAWPHKLLGALWALARTLVHLAVLIGPFRRFSNFTSGFFAA